MLSIYINLYQSISIYINLYQSISIYLNLYQSISIYINLSQSISIYINLYQSISIYINLYQSISIYINLYQSISIYINLYQSISIYLNLYLWWVVGVFTTASRSSPLASMKVSIRKSNASRRSCDFFWDFMAIFAKKMVMFTSFYGASGQTGLRTQKRLVIDPYLWAT